MSLCEMTPHQIVTYVNAWAVLIAVVLSNLAVWAVMKATGAYNEETAYGRGFADAQAKFEPRDRNLALGLTDYDAQRASKGGDGPTTGP